MPSGTWKFVGKTAAVVLSFRINAKQGCKSQAQLAPQETGQKPHQRHVGIFTHLSDAMWAMFAHQFTTP
ncbi:MAG: hypothetical protein NXI04_21825 [Planctomycetaceae bacterium]|nr:hypothetical protein [Planctomycetaceae bacterium]